MDLNRLSKAPKPLTHELSRGGSCNNEPKGEKFRRLAVWRFLAMIAMALWVGSAVMSVATSKAQAFAASAPADDSPGDEGPNDPNSPDSPDHVGGHWSGTIIDNSLGAGTLDLTILQRKGRMAGGFDISFQSSSEDMAGGLRGSINGSKANLGLRPNRPRGCAVNVVGTVQNGTELKGTYSPVNPAQCNGVAGGTFDVLLEHS